MNLPTGKPFSRKKDFIVYDATGSVIDPAPKVLKSHRFSVNYYAPNMARHKAKKTLGVNTHAFFTLVDRKGEQHVLKALPGEAETSNVQGIVSLAAWMRQVTRRKQKKPASNRPRSLTNPSMRFMDRILLCTEEIGLIANNNLLTQGDRNHNALDHLLEDVEDHVACMQEGVEK